MKKMVIGLGGVVLLGAAWAGASWYTGTKIEARIGEQLDYITQEIAKVYPKDVIKVSFENIKNGVFSTELDYKIEYLGDSNSSSPLVVDKDHLTIYHGPFPLNRLTSFKLAPRMFAFDRVIDTSFYPIKAYSSENEYNEFKQGLKRITNSDKIGTLFVDTHYSNVTDIDFSLVGGNFVENGSHGSFSGLDLSASIKESGIARLSLNMDHLSVEKDNKKVVIEKVAMSSASSDSFYMGDGDFSIKNIFIDMPGSSNPIRNFALKDLSMESASSGDKQKATGDIVMTSTVKDILINKESLGDISFKTSMKNIPTDIYDKISVVDYFLLHDSEKVKTEMLNLFIEKGLEISLDELKIKNNAGSSMLSLMAGFGKTNAINADMPINRFKFDTNISIPMIKELAYQVSFFMAGPSLTDETKKTMMNDINEKIAMFQFILAARPDLPFVIDGDTVKSAIKYLPEEKRIDINGKKIDANILDELGHVSMSDLLR